MDTIVVENEITDNVQRLKLDWTIYNKPLEYVQLVLGGELDEYLRGTPEHLKLNKRSAAHQSLIGGFVPY